MKKTINVDFVTECARPETAVKRFIAKHPECAHWAEELCYMFTSGTETECNKDAYGKRWTFSLHAYRDGNTYTIAIIEREPETDEEASKPGEVLYYEERGCDMNPKYYDGISDMNNHRIVFFDIPGKDGKTFIIEMGEYTARFKGIGVKKTRYYKNRLHTCLQYECERGCFGISGTYCGINHTDFRYTREGVLRFINAISAKQYSRIQPREKITLRNIHRNYTGEGLMIRLVNDRKEHWKNRPDFQKEYDVYRTTGGEAYIRIRNYLYEYAGTENETETEKHETGYIDITLILDRITDEAKVKYILENSEVVNTGTV